MTVIGYIKFGRCILHAMSALGIFNCLFLTMFEYLPMSDARKQILRNLPTILKHHTLCLNDFEIPTIIFIHLSNQRHSLFPSLFKY